MTHAEALEALKEAHKLTDSGDQKSYRLYKLIRNEIVDRLRRGWLETTEYKPSSMVEVMAPNSKFEFILYKERPTWITADRQRNGIAELKQYMEKHPERCTLLEYRCVCDLHNYMARRKHLLASSFVRSRLKQNMTRLKIDKGRVILHVGDGEKDPGHRQIAPTVNS